MGDLHLKRFGGCVSLFCAAIICDILGLVVLFVGIFANLTLDGRFYGDFLIYSGSLVIFCSLALWLMWYVGNIQVADEDLDLSSKNRTSFARLARKLSERLNANVPPSQGRQKFAFDDDDSGGDHGGRDVEHLAAHKPSKVTWGKSSSFDGFVNKGYDDDGTSSTASSDQCPKEPITETPELPPNGDGTGPVL